MLAGEDFVGEMDLVRSSVILVGMVSYGACRSGYKQKRSKVTCPNGRLRTH